MNIIKTNLDRVRSWIYELNEKKVLLVTMIGITERNDFVVLSDTSMNKKQVSDMLIEISNIFQEGNVRFEKSEGKKFESDSFDHCAEELKAEKQMIESIIKDFEERLKNYVGEDYVVKTDIEIYKKSYKPNQNLN